MKVQAAVICFTARGRDTAVRAARCLIEAGAEASVWCRKKKEDTLPEPAADSGYKESEPGEIIELKESVRDWTGERFADSQLIVFVGATGIAVRSIAPFLKSKTSDPAVLCVDETARFVISLVSGHIGGANEFALRLADALGAQPVVTTATDLNGLWAVDVFARKNGLIITDMKKAKFISAALLDGRRIRLGSEFPVTGDVPEQMDLVRIEDVPEQMDLLQEDDETEQGSRDDVQAPDVAVSIRTQPPQTLALIPRIVTLGVGCRKDKDPEELDRFICRVLEEEHIDPRSIEAVASIDLKKDEPAITIFAARYHLPYDTWTAEELRAADGTFTESGFVSSITGVDNVCERSAVRSSDGGRLILRKRAENGMTLAAAVRRVEIRL